MTVKSVNKFTRLLEDRQLPQAILLVSENRQAVLDFIPKFIKKLFCQTKVGCDNCPECIRLNNNSHPDCYHVGLEDDKGIKIDEIRSLAYAMTKTAQRSRYRVAIIYNAEKMNVFAANALLKILEEPPRDAIFILVARHTANILPTILSRCQKFVNVEENYYSPNYLSSPVLSCDIYSNNTSLVATLQEVIMQEKSPPLAARIFLKFGLNEILGWFYLVNAQIIMFNVLGRRDNLLGKLPELIPHKQLFYYNDKINRLQKDRSLNIAINAELALEDLLIDYARIING